MTCFVGNASEEALHDFKYIEKNNPEYVRKGVMVLWP